MTNKQFFLRWLKNKNAYSNFVYESSIYFYRRNATKYTYDEWMESMFNHEYKFLGILTFTMLWSNTRQGSVYWSHLHDEWECEVQRIGLTRIMRGSYHMNKS